VGGVAAAAVLALTSTGAGRVGVVAGVVDVVAVGDGADELEVDGLLQRGAAAPLIADPPVALLVDHPGPVPAPVGLGGELGHEAVLGRHVLRSHAVTPSGT